MTPMMMTPTEILAKLVSFPTVSSETNLPLVDWVETYLESHGVASHRVYDETGQKASIYASIGPDVAGGVALSGHTDVVPVEGQDWSTDPWVLTEKDGRLYARGSCDMKGFDALALAAVPAAVAVDLKRPLQIAFSYDEEVGLLGAPGLAAAMLETFPNAKAAAVIVGEPTEMRVVSGHKGCDAIEVHVRGYEVHSSLVHEGVSAIMNAAKLINWITDQTTANMAKTPDPVAAMFHPPFTTLHVGVINGGTASNITAKDCRFNVDIRCVPTESGADCLAALRAEAARISADMQAIHPDTGIDVKLFAPGPGVKPEEGGEAERLARQLTGDNASHTVSYGTDGGHFQEAGFSVVVCGPGNIDQAHKPDEFLEMSELAKGEVFLSRLIEHLQN